MKYSAREVGKAVGRFYNRAIMSETNLKQSQAAAEAAVEPNAAEQGGVSAVMLKEAFQAAWPIVLGYIVLGIPCGILGVAAGMDVWMIAVMSLLFYSGAGQYMIPNMWLAGNPITAIVASVSLVNTRQMLYGTSLSQFCGGAGKRLSFIFGATVTDESFGVNLARFINGGWSVKHALFVNLFSLSSWTISNVVGALIGSDKCYSGMRWKTYYGIGYLLLKGLKTPPMHPSAFEGWLESPRCISRRAALAFP